MNGLYCPGRRTPPPLCPDTGLSNHGDPVFPHFWGFFEPRFPQKPQFGITASLLHNLQYIFFLQYAIRKSSYGPNPGGSPQPSGAQFVTQDTGRVGLTHSSQSRVTIF